MSLSNVEVRHHALPSNSFTRDRPTTLFSANDAQEMAARESSLCPGQYDTSQDQSTLNAARDTSCPAISHSTRNEGARELTIDLAEETSQTSSFEKVSSTIEATSCFDNLITASRDDTIALTPVSLHIDIPGHPQEDILSMLSALLSRITATNDTLHIAGNASAPKAGSPLIAFHARNIPSISIKAYLSRILKYCPMSSDIFLSLLVYFDRMSHIASTAASLHPEAFTSTKQLMGNDSYSLAIDSYNVHRLVITGIVVASKFCSDVFYTNSRYAKVIIALCVR